MIEDSSFSPFATVENGERPDKVAARLLEGRIAILIHLVLTVPYMLIEAFQVPDDYYLRIFNANLTRLIRLFTLLLPLSIRK